MSSHPIAHPRASREERVKLSTVLKWLVADGLVTKTNAEEVALIDRINGGSKKNPLILVADRQWVDERNPSKPLTLETLTEWFAGRVKMEYVHIDPLKIDFSSVGDLMTNTYAERYSILPIKLTASEVTIATSEPFLQEWVPDVERMLRRSVKRVFANPEDISRYLVEFFNLARSVKKAKEKGDIVKGISSFEQLVELGRNRQFDANDQHIVHIVDWLLEYAFEQRASDIHIEPRREMGIVRFRIDGVLHQVYQIPGNVMAAMTSRIKLLGRMDVVEKRRPLDGRVKTRTQEGKEVELRLSTLPTAFGEKLVMRIFDPDVLVRDFRQLGFNDTDLARWNGMTARPNGIILVTGPTGSGKTTTLYSTLKHLATPEVNVCTIEDPIEMIEPSFNQVQVQANLDMNFAEGVRALMRQDPDIIMIGEIRDLNTADMAIQAALTGHLVLSTLHTNDAPSAITRLTDLGVPRYLINATLLGVMAQRLVRTLCPKCKQASPITEEEAKAWQELVSPWKAKMPENIHRPVGCLDCRMTGYTGRVGLYEIMLMSPELRRLVYNESDIAHLREQGWREGMHPLRLSGAQKIASGLTSLEEVIKVAPPADSASH